MGLVSFLFGSSFIENVVKTVKTSGGDFTTIQSALDSFRELKLGNGNQILVDQGTWSENIIIPKLTGKLSLRGDLRSLAGLSFNDDIPIQSSNPNAGSGTCQLANAGAIISVTGSGGNPDFQADGWVSGDKVGVLDNAGAYSEPTILSVSGNTITLTTTAPTLGTNRSSIVLLPNRKITASAFQTILAKNNNCEFELIGFYVVNTGSLDACELDNFNFVSVRNCLFSASGANGVSVKYSSEINFNHECTLINSDNGIFVSDNSDSNFDGITVFNCAISGIYLDHDSNASFDSGITKQCQNGVVTRNSSSVFCDNSYDVVSNTGRRSENGSAMRARNNILKGNGVASFGFIAITSSLDCQSSLVNSYTNTGYASDDNSSISASNATAQSCLFGYRANDMGFLDATGTSANNSGNTTNYSPAISGNLGNNNAMILFS